MTKPISKQQYKRHPFTAKEYHNAMITVADIVVNVCCAFNVTLPKPVRVFKTYLSKYRWTDSRLNIGWEAKDYIESITLHELAHHIVYKNTGPHRHTEYFWHVLWEIIGFYFGDHALYCWKHEYKHGKTYARNRGIQVK